MSVSDLLREAAMDLVERYSRQPVQIEVEVVASAQIVIEPLFYASGRGISGPAQSPTRGVHLDPNPLSA